MIGRTVSRYRVTARIGSAYNLACVFCHLEKKAEGMDALKRAWEAGFKDPDWARRDPDLTILRDDPEFDRLYPPTPA